MDNEVVEVVETAAASGMPWYAWVVIAAIVVIVGYRLNTTRKGGGKPSGPRSDDPPKHIP